MNLSDSSKGIALALVGIMTLSPDSLLIRLIDTDLWTVTFLRSIFIGLSLSVFMLILYRGRVVQRILQMDRYAVLIMLFMTVSNIFFVASVQTTSVVHTLIIVGAAPVVAAVMGVVFLKETVSTKTWSTIVVVIGCLVLVVYDKQKSSLLGDFYALMACLLWSTIFIFGRLTRTNNMLAAMCISGFINASWTYPLAQLSSLNGQQIALGLLLGCLVGAALSQITLAPRFIPAAEVAMFMPLETVFGSFLVWWVLGEIPSIITMTAGSVMILAIMLYSYTSLKRSAAKRCSP